MSDYGRNFEWLTSPRPEDRLGRYINGDADVPQGAPVVVTDGPDADERLVLGLCTGATEPVKAQHGIILWEQVYEGYVDRDPVLTRWSDLDIVPAGKPAQLISGDYVRAAYRNTEDETFLQTRSYSGRVMVAGLGATLELAQGDFLTPGDGNDTDGYWAKTTNRDEAWLYVWAVLNDVGVVQVQMLF
jgi:hypothetical protein